MRVIETQIFFWAKVHFFPLKYFLKKEKEKEKENYFNYNASQLPSILIIILRLHQYRLKWP